MSKNSILKYMKEIVEGNEKCDNSINQGLAVARTSGKELGNSQKEWMDTFEHCETVSDSLFDFEILILYNDIKEYLTDKGVAL